MRPIIIDTNAYVAFKRGETSIIEVTQHAEIIGMSPIVIGELLGGFDCGNKSKRIAMNCSIFSNPPELEYFL